MSLEVSSIFESLIKHIKPTRRAVFAVCCGYTIYALIPTTWETKQRFLRVAGNYVVLLDVVGVIAVGFAITFMAEWLWKLFSAVQRRRRTKAYLEKLSPREKGILNEFISGNRKAVGLHITDGDVNMLELQGILVRLPTLSTIGSRFEYSTVPWVYEHLHANARLLEGFQQYEDPESY